MTLVKNNTGEICDLSASISEDVAEQQTLLTSYTNFIQSVLSAQIDTKILDSLLSTIYGNIQDAKDNLVMQHDVILSNHLTKRKRELLKIYNHQSLNQIWELDLLVNDCLVLLNHHKKEKSQ